MGGFSWSPDGTRIAFSATVNPDLIQGKTADIYVLNARRRRRQASSSRSPAPTTTRAGRPTAARSSSRPRWARPIISPTTPGSRWSPPTAARRARSPIASTRTRRSSSGTPTASTSPALQKTASHLFRVDPATGTHHRACPRPDDLMAGGFSFTRDGRRMAFSASSPTSLTEVFVSDVADFAPRALTKMTEQAKPFTLGTREVISWKSQDGAHHRGRADQAGRFRSRRRSTRCCASSTAARPASIGRRCWRPTRATTRPTSGRRAGR